MALALKNYDEAVLLEKASFHLFIPSFNAMSAEYCHRTGTMIASAEKILS